MSWYEKIIAAHASVTGDASNVVGHGGRMKSDRYFVWQEDGNANLGANNTTAEAAVTGTTDLFTKQEFDPWKEAFEAALDAAPDIFWSLKSVQFEHDTGFWHYEWKWTVLA